MTLLSIRDKLVLYSSMIIFLVAITITVISYLNERNQSLATYQREALKVAKMIEEPIAQGLQKSNFSSIKSILYNLKVNPDIHDALILDARGGILAELTHVYPVQNVALFRPFMPDILRSTSFETFKNNQLLITGGPIKVDNQTVGYLYIQFSLEKYYERLRAELYINLAALGLCLTIGLILARVLSNHFTKPIIELIQLTHKISAGHTDVQFPTISNKEFGVLSQALKVMVQNLHQIHARLLEATIELDKKVKERTKELEAATMKAEEANLEKSSFLANVSHEIRTPMNGIIGTASLLKTTPINEQQKKYIDIMELSAESLLNLINDILDLSKIESGKIELESIRLNIRKIAEDVMDLLEYKIKEKNLRFGCIVDPRIPLQLIGDPSRVRQILINLVTNAIKFTEQGHIKISILFLEENDKKCTFKVMVQDTGIGVPPDKMDRLFKAFSQVDASTTRQFGGTGLGLAISKKLTELMGGEMGVISMPEKGSNFWFILSLEKDPTQRLITFSPDLANKNLLILENDPINLEFFSSLLSHWKCNPQIIRKESLAEEALKKAYEKQNFFDVFIINEKMATTEFIDKIQLIEKDHKTPTLYISEELNQGLLQERYKSTYNIFNWPLKEKQVYHTLLRALGIR